MLALETVRAGLYWKKFDNGEAAIIISSSMLALFDQLAEASGVETHDMLINCLISPFLNLDDFEISEINEH